ncbi:hypothetical protein Hanom_Chr14g01259841 [Helianthus anomalus]
MLMVWRVLYTLEHIVEHEGIDIGLSELIRLYNLVSHGSHRYLFKSKPQQPHPILKTTKNDTNWRNQFFFVRRDFIPNGSHLPMKWNTDAISLSHIQASPLTEERITAFWKLDPAIRTFPPRTRDSQEMASTSCTMSSAAESSKSASRFSIGDLQDIVSPQSIKKELVASQSNPEVKGMSTRGKGTKRKKTTESSEGLPLMECQFHDYVSKKFAEVQILLDQRLVEAEEKILDFQKIAVAKDKKNPRLKRITTPCRRSCSLLRSLLIRRGWRSEWDVEAWAKRLAELGDDEEPEEVRALEFVGSGDKDPKDAATGGSGKGGEEKVDEAAKV